MTEVEPLRARTRDPLPKVPAQRKPRDVAQKVLTRSQALQRLRDYTTQRGAVSSRWIERNDPILLRSIRVHFGGLPEARRAANVSRPPPANRRWSQLRVINELRQIQRAGRVRMTLRGLMDAGYKHLAGAIGKYVGSIRRARRLARIPEPGTLPTDVCGGMGYTATRREDQRLVLAALKNFGTWRRAMEAAGLGHLVGLRPPGRRSGAPGIAWHRASKSRRSR